MDKAQYQFRLSERSAERLEALDALAQEANLLGLAVGEFSRETSFGRNAGLRVALSGLRRFARYEFGDLALSRLPFLSGGVLVMPPATLHLLGDSVRLRGSGEDGSQEFPLVGLEDGDYALILESWVSLVGASTEGVSPTLPATSGVIDAVNKPDAHHLYHAGNLEGARVPDAALVDTAIQTYKAFQRQYRLRLIRDIDLTRYVSDLLPGGVGYQATPVPELVRARLGYPALEGEPADRQVLACKLAAVSINGADIELFTGDTRRDSFGYEPARQPLVPYRMSREELERWIKEQAETVLEAQAALKARLLVLESVRRAAVVQMDESQIIEPRSQNGSTVAQRLRYGKEIWNPEGWHDVVSYPTRIQIDFAGIVHVTASAFFAAHASQGLRGIQVLLSDAPTGFAQAAAGDPHAATPVTVSCELSVSPGDYIEIEPWQTSESVLEVQPGSQLIVRRIL